MGPISITITIDAPRERVFDLICDLARRPAWIDHFAEDYRIERLPPAGLGAAARYRAGAPGGIDYMETVISEAEKPHKIVEQGRGGRLNRVPVRAVWELVAGSAGVTSLTLTFWTEPSEIVDRLRDVRGGRWWRRRWGRALRRLRGLIESGEDAAEPMRVAGTDRLSASVP